jgi:hypothetical protein
MLADVRPQRYAVREKPAMMRIIQGDFSDPRVIALLETHLISARAETAPGSARALDLIGLQSRR